MIAQSAVCQVHLITPTHPGGVAQ